MIVRVRFSLQEMNVSHVCLHVPFFSPLCYCVCIFQFQLNTVTWEMKRVFKLVQLGINIHFPSICLFVLTAVLLLSQFFLLSFGSQQFSKYLRDWDNWKKENDSERKEGMQLHKSPNVSFKMPTNRRYKTIWIRAFSSLLPWLSSR